LDPDADRGFLRDWREARLDPEKNRGYALQWFLFAAVAAVIYLRRNVKIGGTLGPP
jgi:surfeit locus 1 family protein